MQPWKPGENRLANAFKVMPYRCAGPGCKEVFFAGPTDRVDRMQINGKGYRICTKCKRALDGQKRKEGG